MVSRFGKALGRATALWRKAIPTGNVLYDASGAQIGHIDVIQISPSHLRVAGWVADDMGRNTAHNMGRALVTLRTGQGQVSAAPTLPRPDVAAAFGVPAAVGFDLAMLRDGGQAHLIFTFDDARQIIQPLPAPHIPLRRRPSPVSWARLP